MALEVGQRLGAYEILGTLGAGGMGEVYRARDTRLDRDVAIKVLPEAFREDPEARARFEREAKAVAALSHPNIMGIHDFGQDNGVVYAVVELLDGETLREALAAGPMLPRRAVDVARMVACGLGAAHDSGFVHRDLKPENLFLTRDGNLKILDFGLARNASDATTAVGDDTPTFTHLTGAGVVLGTVHYMSPEQTRGEPVGPASDIFSLGTVLYEMLCGKRPFEAETVPETMTAILREEPPPFPEGESGASLVVQRIVQRCLEKQPEQRFHSAQDLAFALETSSEISSATRAISEKTPRAGRRPNAWIPVLALVVGLVAGGGGSAPRRATPPPPPRPGGVNAV
jgi:serine/threonine protein kinase